MKIKANGISMNYELSGRRGRYFTWIHGSGYNLKAWYNQVPVFSRRYRVLTYDVRGFGQTELPAGELSTELWVSDLYALLQALNISEAILVGHSMGAKIAVAFTLAYPEMVKALILSTGGTGRRSEEELRRMSAHGQTRREVLEKEGMEGVVRVDLEQQLSPGFAEKNPEIVARYREIMLQNKPEGLLRVIEQMGRPPTTPVDLNKITCPTLVIGGEYDLSGPEGAKVSHQAIRGSQLKIFPRGHLPQLEIPKEYNETVLGFLAGVGLS